MESTPRSVNFESALERLRGSKVYLLPIDDAQGVPMGNHGDALMNSVFELMLERAGIHLVSRADEANQLLVPPNGAMLQAYRFPRLLSERLNHLPDLPLLIAPSSARFPTEDPSQIFRGRTSRTVWYLREKKSYDALLSDWGSGLEAANVTLLLDADVVTRAEFTRSLFPQGLREDSILVAARIDTEASRTDLQRSESASPDSRANFTVSLKRALARLLSVALPACMARAVNRVRKRTAVRRASEALMRRIPVEELASSSAGTSRTVAIDLSSKQLVSYDTFLREIARARVVVTDRLHVGLPAALLGKRVFLVEAGYHKLTGVYEQSLKDHGNVTLINS